MGKIPENIAALCDSMDAVEDVVEAARKALIELAYLREQVKARPGGSVDRAYHGLRDALEKLDEAESRGAK
jgi:hypothetical protein